MNLEDRGAFPCQPASKIHQTNYSGELTNEDRMILCSLTFCFVFLKKLLLLVISQLCVTTHSPHCVIVISAQEEHLNQKHTAGEF